jgi:hypothetical protein
MGAQSFTRSWSYRSSNQPNTRRKVRKMKNIDGEKLRKALEKLIPSCDLDVDNEGQVIIYTNLKETKNGNYKKIK